LKTEKETLLIEVGPGWYVEKQPVKIEAKDNLEIKGSRVAPQGKPNGSRTGRRREGLPQEAAHTGLQR